MFVLSMGLMGVAALIPAGRFQMVQAEKSDSSSALGRAAYRSVRLRGMLDPDAWLNFDDKTWPNPANAWEDVDAPTQPLFLTSPVEGGNSICIDPWFIAQNANSPDYAGNLAPLGVFPLLVANDPPHPPDVTAVVQRTNIPRMQRVTLRAFAGAVAMTAPLAAHLFTWQDDLLFDVPENTDLRPLQRFARDSANNDRAFRREYSGDYSWILTVTPSVGETGSANGRSYDTAVVVFYKRNLVAPPPGETYAQRGGNAPAERMVFCDFINGPLKFGGGEVRLRLPMEHDETFENSPELSDMPPLVAGSWIMLAGFVNDQSSNTDAFVEHDQDASTDPQLRNLGRRAVFRWYRVVSLDEPTFHEDESDHNNDGWRRNVTLAGPDWTPDYNPPQGAPMFQPFIDADGTNVTGYTCHAALFTNVVGVFEKTIEFDE